MLFLSSPPCDRQECVPCLDTGVVSSLPVFHLYSSRMGRLVLLILSTLVGGSLPSDWLGMFQHHKHRWSHLLLNLECTHSCLSLQSLHQSMYRTSFAHPCSLVSPHSADIFSLLSYPGCCNNQ